MFGKSFLQDVQIAEMIFQTGSRISQVIATAAKFSYKYERWHTAHVNTTKRTGNYRYVCIVPTTYPSFSSSFFISAIAD